MKHYNENKLQFSCSYYKRNYEQKPLKLWGALHLT